MAARGRNVRGLWIHAGLSAVALALLAYAVWTNRGKLAEALQGPFDGRFWRLVGLAFAVYLAALTTSFLRWFTLVRALGLPFRLRDALRLGFIGNVFNLVIPGAVGGDLIKAAFLCREQSRKTQAVASMFIDRALGLLGLFLLAGASGAFAWAEAPDQARRLIVLVWLAVLLGVAGLGVLFTPALYRPLNQRLKGRGRLETIVVELETMASAYRDRLGTVLGALAMAVAGHSMLVVAFYAMSLALFRGHVPSLADHFLLVPLTLFTTAVPLPFGALGVSEQASQQLFDMVRHPKGAVAMMGFRVLMYAGGLVSALVYLVNLNQVRTLKETVREQPEPELLPSGSPP